MLPRVRPGPLALPAFRWLLVARTVSTLGNAVAPVALAFTVLDLTGSVSDLGLVVASRSVTQVLLLLYGGVLADRLPLRRLLVGSGVLSAATQAVAAGLVLTGSASIASLAVLEALNGAVTGLAFPAFATAVPQVVEPDQLPRANALLRVGQNSSAVVGAAAAGLVVAVAGPGVGIAVDAAAYVVATACVTRLRVRPVARAERTGTWQELRTGWREFVSRRWVWVVVLQFTVVNASLSGAEGVLGPQVADRSVGRGAYGLVLSLGAAGLVAGSVLALKIQPRRALLAGTLAVLLTALPAAALALTPSVIGLGLAFFVSSIAVEQFGVAWDTSLQQNVPTDRLARVYSYDALGSFVAIPVGQVVVGPLAASLGVRTTLLLCAAAVVVVTLLALTDRSLRTLERATSGLRAEV